MSVEVLPITVISAFVQHSWLRRLTLSPCLRLVLCWYLDLRSVEGGNEAVVLGVDAVHHLVTPLGSWVYNGEWMIGNWQ